MILYAAECATQVALDGIQCLGEPLAAFVSLGGCWREPGAVQGQCLSRPTLSPRNQGGGMTCAFFSIAGGNGYINDYPMGRFLRDAKLYEIGAGTSEVRRLVIGRAFNATFK